MENKKLTPEQIKAANTKPGAAINIADDEKVNPRLVKERVATQNNISH